MKQRATSHLPKTQGQNDEFKAKYIEHSHVVRPKNRGY